ncbi:unnamed protein product [Ixodes persulcatus]
MCMSPVEYWGAAQLEILIDANLSSLSLSLSLSLFRPHPCTFQGRCSKDQAQPIKHAEQAEQVEQNTAQQLRIKEKRKIRTFCLVFECIMKQVLCMQHMHQYTSKLINSITQR